MSVHQCPKCELRFTWQTELDDHCWHDHPQFRHDYPYQKPVRPTTPAQPADAPTTPTHPPPSRAPRRRAEP